MLYVCDHLAEERSLREAEAIADAGASSPVPMTGVSGGGVVAAPAALQRLQPIFRQRRERSMPEQVKKSLTRALLAALE